MTSELRATVRASVELGPQRTLDDILDEHPRLTDFGIGLFQPSRLTQPEHAAQMAEQRRVLRAHATHIAQVSEWLTEHLQPVKTCRVHSYSLKHLIERAMHEYTSNGEAIAAALMAGYPHHYRQGPNVLFGMSARDYQAILQDPHDTRKA